MNGQTADKVDTFRSWLLDNGGYIHPDVFLTPGASFYLVIRRPKCQLSGTVSSGLNVVSHQDIPADTKIVSCPFNLAITPAVARKGLAAVLRVYETHSTFDGWSERQLIASYLCMHNILDTTE